MGDFPQRYLEYPSSNRHHQGSLAVVPTTKRDDAVTHLSNDSLSKLSVWREGQDPSSKFLTFKFDRLTTVFSRFLDRGAIFFLIGPSPPSLAWLAERLRCHNERRLRSTHEGYLANSSYGEKLRAFWKLT